jgi:hypothetical protein
MCAEELRRARQSLNTKESGYLKARDSTLRHVNSAPFNNGSVDTNRKLKDLDKKKRQEEEAFTRVFNLLHYACVIPLIAEDRRRKRSVETRA